MILSNSCFYFFRFTRNVVNKHEPPTIGVDYSAKSIVLRDGTIVKAKIWDTGISRIEKVEYNLF